jgi:hypothetical protein
MTNANYAVRFSEDNYFDTGTHNVHGPVTGSAKLIGIEELVIPARLRNPPARWSSNSLTFTGGPQPFSARAELHRLLNTPPVYSASELADAEDAVHRLATPGTDEEKSAWATSLAEDLIAHRD